MSELSQGLSNTIEFSIGGQEFTISKITVGILADFETAMASRDLQRGLKALGDATPAERAEFIWRSQKRQGVEDSLDSITSAEGMRLMLWLMLKAGGNDLTESQVGDLLTLQTIGEISALFTAMMDSGNIDIPGESGNAEAMTEAAGTPSSQD